MSYRDELSAILQANDDKERAAKQEALIAAAIVEAEAAGVPAHRARYWTNRARREWKQDRSWCHERQIFSEAEAIAYYLRKNAIPEHNGRLGIFAYRKKYGGEQ